jgi:hypothetical protein
MAFQQHASSFAKKIWKGNARCGPSEVLKDLSEGATMAEATLWSTLMPVRRIKAALS